MRANLLLLGAWGLGAAACVPDDPPKPTSVQAAPSAFPRSPLRPFTPPPVPSRPTAPVALLPSAAAKPSAPPSVDPPLASGFSDRFDRADLGADWNATTPLWRLEGGRVCVDRAQNHPLWLRRRLPTNARIEFDATTASAEGDIKAEFWGDGKSAAGGVSYNDATSYLTIFGGWKNSFHVLARIDEHATNRPEIRIDDASDDLRARRVEPNRLYHFKVVRQDGKIVHWYVDDLEILNYPDPAPLAGPGHDHFGFNDWEVRLCFDNLSIYPSAP